MTDETKSSGGGERDETDEERIDRNMIELLNELRVALPGVQVLFALELAASLPPAPLTNREQEYPDGQDQRREHERQRNEERMVREWQQRAHA